MGLPFKVPKKECDDGDERKSATEDLRLPRRPKPDDDALVLPVAGSGLLPRRSEGEGDSTYELALAAAALRLLFRFPEPEGDDKDAVTAAAVDAVRFPNLCNGRSRGMYDLAPAIAKRRLLPESSKEGGDGEDAADLVLPLSLASGERDSTLKSAPAAVGSRRSGGVAGVGGGGGLTLIAAGSVVPGLPSGEGDRMYERASAAADLRLLPRLRTGEDNSKDGLVLAAAPPVTLSTPPRNAPGYSVARMAPLTESP